MRLIVLCIVLLASAACNLSSSAPPPPTVEFVETPVVDEVDSPPLLATITVISDPLAPPPATSAPALGSQCQVYITFSGVNVDNKLSMRTEPRSDAPQVFRVPNNIEVYLVPGAQEVEAGGYHWLHVIYIDSPQARYQGWIARDSFETNGVRDPSIATLRNAGRQAGC